MKNTSNDSFIKGLTIFGLGIFVLGSGFNITRNYKRSTITYSTVAEALDMEMEDGYDIKNDESIYVIYDKDITGKEQFHITRKISAYDLNHKYRVNVDGIPFTYSTGDGVDITTKFNLTDENNDYVYFNIFDGSVITAVHKYYYNTKEKVTGNEIIKSMPIITLGSEYLGDKDKFSEEDLESLLNRLNGVEEIKDNIVATK